MTCLPRCIDCTNRKWHGPATDKPHGTPQISDSCTHPVPLEPSSKGIVDLQASTIHAILMKNVPAVTACIVFCSSALRHGRCCKHTCLRMCMCGCCGCVGASIRRSKYSWVRALYAAESSPPEAIANIHFLACWPWWGCGNPSSPGEGAATRWVGSKGDVMGQFQAHGAF